MAAFKDKPNTSVFTSRHVMIANSPITYVVHDEDGDWQFLGPEENIEDKDVMIVSLQQVIQHDPTVLEIADLPRGGVAARGNRNAPWKRGTV